MQRSQGRCWIQWEPQYLARLLWALPHEGRDPSSVCWKLLLSIPGDGQSSLCRLHGLRSSHAMQVGSHGMCFPCLGSLGRELGVWISPSMWH